MDPAQHAHERNALEGLLRQLPGFKGYLEQEYRRESDHLCRRRLADQLGLAKQGIDQAMRGLVERVQLDELPKYETLRGRIDGFRNSVLGADRGYSGLFDYVRITEATLEQAYAIDLALVGDVEQLVTACRGLASNSSGGSSLSLEQVVQLLAELEAKFRQRGEILEGMGK